jgi:hypothetical protein
MNPLIEARNTYLNKLGYSYDKVTSRRREHVLIRYAFMNASRGLLTIEATGRIWNKDHATVIHAAKMHPINSQFSKEYPHYFILAEKVIKDLPNISLPDITFKPDRSLILENRKLKEKVRELQDSIDHLTSLVEFYQNKDNKLPL